MGRERRQCLLDFGQLRITRVAWRHRKIGHEAINGLAVLPRIVPRQQSGATAGVIRWRWQPPSAARTGEPVQALHGQLAQHWHTARANPPWHQVRAKRPGIEEHETSESRPLGQPPPSQSHHPNHSPAGLYLADRDDAGTRRDSRCADSNSTDSPRFVAQPAAHVVDRHDAIVRRKRANDLAEKNDQVGLPWTSNSTSPCPSST